MFKIFPLGSTDFLLLTQNSSFSKKKTIKKNKSDLTFAVLAENSQSESNFPFGNA